MSNVIKPALIFCSNCGAKLEVKIPLGDHFPRHVCDNCGAIHYQNPKIVVGCVPEYEDGRILICKRAIEPRLGYWTIPAGFMENNETLQHAAARESYEEALAKVEIGSLLTVCHVLRAHQVHVFFRAKLPSLEFGAGPESLEVKLVEPKDIPWPDIAFPSTDVTLRRFFEDKAAGREDFHFVEFGPNAPDPVRRE